MSAFLLDTNIISGILRKERIIAEHARDALVDHQTIFLSAVVYYESKRGLLKRDARKQMDALDHWMKEFKWCDVVRGDWEEAARLWMERDKKGRPVADADLLIAIQAKRLGAILVTDNEKDFDGLEVEIENWRRTVE